MKNYEEMARDVFQRIDEYETEKKAKRAKITRAAAFATPVCAAAVVGIGLWNGGALTPDRNQLISSTVDSTVSDSDIFLSADNDTSENNGNTNEEHNADAVDTSQITSYEPQTMTEEPTVQTDAPVQQTDTVIQTEPAEQIVTPTEGGNIVHSWCIFGSRLEWNGTAYYDNDIANISAYTKDRYIGKVSGFKGEYSDAFNYRISPDDSVYTVKETDTVLLVLKADSNSPYGAVIVMSSPDWSLDKYEPERLDPGYVDPNASSDGRTVVFNGFCQ